MELSQVAKTKIKDTEIKAKLLAANADTVFTKEDNLVVVFTGPQIQADPKLPRDARLQVLKNANAQLQQQAEQALESLGIPVRADECSGLWIVNTVTYEPTEIRADRLAALLDNDRVTSIESGKLLNAELGQAR